MRVFIYIAAVSILLCGRLGFAASFPQTLNYQGMLQTKTGQQVNSPQDITFSLYTTPIGAELPFWVETLSNVPVSNGQFSVTLGTVTPFDPSKFSGDTYLGIKVGSQTEMLPRQKMTSVPYAFNAVNAVSALNGIPKGGVIMWSGALNQVPVGWAICDGNNGTPNLKDRFIVGVGDRFGSGNPRNLTGGEEEHILKIEEMPTHNHGGATGGQSSNHTHNGTLTSVNRDGSSGTRVREADPAGSFGGVAFQTGQASSDHVHEIGYDGGGQPHNILPPYYALAFIMKL